MSSSAGVSIRWYPNRRYTAMIDSSTWSRTATSAGSRSRIPLAGLLSILMAPSRRQAEQHKQCYGPPPALRASINAGPAPAASISAPTWKPSTTHIAAIIAARSTPPTASAATILLR